MNIENAWETWLLVASALVIFLLGIAHLVITFRGHKLYPRDRELAARMREISPVITRQTTMWRAWIGFNASHSYGAILFGLVYGYLALAHGTLLFDSVFLLSVGLLLLGGYIVLAKRYWFHLPFRGIVLATVFFGLAIIASRV